MTTWIKQIAKAGLRVFTASVLTFVLVLSGFPSQALTDYVSYLTRDNNVVDLLYKAQHDKSVIDGGFASLLEPEIPTAHAAQFSIQTGYYMGNGGAKSISGIGFKPEFVLIKPNTNAGTGAVWKTEAMPVSNSAYLIATADSTAGNLTFEADGFRVAGTNTNTVNVGHNWTAFAGSDCTASGTFCVGTYVGTGTGSRLISTGFDPNLVIVKRSTAVAGNWRSTAMGANDGQYFAATTQDTTGTLFSGIGGGSGGFTVGATNNTSAGVFYYVAFKSSAGGLSVGSYTGTGAAQSITAPGFEPDFVFAKNANAAVAVGAVFNITESQGDSTSFFTDTANVVDAIKSLDATGFTVGAQSTTSGSGNTIYYAAFGGASNTPSASGTFTYASGSYTGDGAYKIIDNIGFSPDLIIIKSNSTQAGVFRTSTMGGDSTAYLDAATANLTGAIIASSVDSFTIGNSATVNSSGVTYYWQAFGGAWKPDTNSGAADFYIGAYYGNGVARSINRLPFQADLTTIKRSGATGGVFTTSAHTAGNTSFFAATADAANVITSLDSDGFSIGTGANVNTAANYYWYFGFDAGTNMTVGTYSGNGTSQSITTSPTITPQYLWAKSTAATRGVQRSDQMPTTSAIPFINVASISNAITAINPNGFSVGTATETNSSGTNNYHYVVWGTPYTPGTLTVDIVDSGYSSVSSPTFSMNTVNTSASCQTATGTFGSSSQRIYIDNNNGANSGWTLTVSASLPTSVWNSAGTDYDFNDPTGSGCSDGGDADSLGGQMTLSPTSATLNTGTCGSCSTSNISLGSAAAFSEGVTNSITLLTASAGSDDVGDWVLTGIPISQTIPASQPAASDYTIPMILTVTAN